MWLARSSQHHYLSVSSSCPQYYHVFLIQCHIDSKQNRPTVVADQNVCIGGVPARQTSIVHEAFAALVMDATSILFFNRASRLPPLLYPRRNTAATNSRRKHTRPPVDNTVLIYSGEATPISPFRKCGWSRISTPLEHHQGRTRAPQPTIA
ncbi:hypothetical protein LZ32DRAFT_193602 [Colletotrichum eremochloae]|nr:hypothetical protein LZ32DRAFT_193602 [Colletotrichum eremochloae]